MIGEATEVEKEQVEEVERAMIGGKKILMARYHSKIFEYLQNKSRSG